MHDLQADGMVWTKWIKVMGKKATDFNQAKSEHGTITWHDVA